MITPAGGFVSLRDAFILGVIGASSIFLMLKFKFTHKARELRWVDPADVFATHAFGGFLATILTGLFGRKEYAAYDDTTKIIGGVIYDGHLAQLFIQLFEGTIGAVWSFVISYIIIAAIDCVPGLEVLCTDEYVSNLRVSSINRPFRDILLGMDGAQMIESLDGSHASDEREYKAFSLPVHLS